MGTLFLIFQVGVIITTQPAPGVIISSPPAAPPPVSTTTAITTSPVRASPFDPNIGPVLSPIRPELPSFTPFTGVAPQEPVQGPPTQPPAPTQPPPTFMFPSPAAPTTPPNAAPAPGAPGGATLTNPAPPSAPVTGESETP